MTKPFMRTLGGLAAAAAIAASPLAVAQEAPLSDKARAAIEEIVHEFITENPEVVYDALVRHQAEEGERTRRAQTDAISENYSDIVEGQPAAGADQPAVTIVEFFDYNCGYCKRSLETVLNIIESERDVRVVFLEYPILAPSSQTASRAALAAERQGRYLDLHVALMEYRGALTDDIVLEIAAAAGLDTETLAADMESGEIAGRVDRNRALGQALGISGTPTFLVGQEIIPGAIEEEDLRRLLEEARSG